MEERDLFGGTGSTDTPIRQYIWGTYIDELIQLTTLTTLGAQNVPAGAYYLLQDLLYRAVALTNSSGGIVEAYDTDAYGQTIIYTGPGPDYLWFTDDDAGSGFTYGANDIIFCGYRYDPETRLYYVRNRMFLTDTGGASVGRWLQRDPIGYEGGINLYEYVNGRAAVEIDPMGLSCFVPCALLAAALFGFWAATDIATGACPASVVPEPGEPGVLAGCIIAILAAIAAFAGVEDAAVRCAKCLKSECHPRQANAAQHAAEQAQQEVDKLEAELAKVRSWLHRLSR